MPVMTIPGWKKIKSLKIPDNNFPGLTELCVYVGTQIQLGKNLFSCKERCKFVFVFKGLKG